MIDKLLWQMQCLRVIEELEKAGMSGVLKEGKPLQDALALECDILGEFPGLATIPECFAKHRVCYAYRNSYGGRLSQFPLICRLRAGRYERYTLKEFLDDQSPTAVDHQDSSS